VTIKYLLPCSCGEKLEIESTQAGQILRCSCGKDVEVPTMQGIRRLEQVVVATNESRPASSFGGAALGIALFGLIVLLAGGSLMYWTYSRRPIMVEMDQVSPWDTWLMWQSLREGVRMPEYSNSPYLEAKKVYKQYLIIGIVIIAIGVILLACSAMLALASRRSQRRHVPQRGP